MAIFISPDFDRYSMPVRSNPPNEPFDIGEPVQIYIPDEDDYDHDKHGMAGVVVDAHQDDAASLPGARHELDDYTYTVSLDEGGTFPARHSDLRPE